MSTQVAVNIQKKDEKILVVPARLLLEKPIVGFYPLSDFSDYVSIIERHKKFLWRSVMEQDPSYKQIIPYLVFRFDDRYFLMQRKSDSSEQRLKNKYTLGIGGHIRQEDVQSKNMVDWAVREFHEEVNYQGNLSITPVGIINDESNSVGKVHTGFVFLLTGESDAISIRSELKSGSLLTLKECSQHAGQMEPWSSLVFDFLQKNNP